VVTLSAEDSWRVWNAVKIRQSFDKMLGGVIFLEVGNIWNRLGDAKMDGVRLSPGLGIRVNAQLGLFLTDHGFNIYPQGSESSGMFYFSVGQAF